MSKETDQLLGHAEDNDGIEEYDNPLPDWWLGMFFFTIVFAVGYTAEYHFISERSQAKAYDQQMAAAKEKWPQSQAPKELSFDDATVAAGNEVYTTTCASCHGANLEGGIGPNLKDSEWIHGGDQASVVATITNGVAAKGMPAWGGILGPDKVAKVAAFVLASNTGEAPAAPADTPPPAAGGADATADAEADVDPMVAGEQVFKANCAACHGENLEGTVGPSLVDDEWIHGGELDQITATITNGVPAKGMVSWGPILGEEKIQQVAQFVHAKAHSTN